MYKNEFKRIIEASRKNSLTFFVGAGVSALSKAPKWQDMIDQICDFLKIEKKQNTPLMTFFKFHRFFIMKLIKMIINTILFLNKA